MLIRVTAVEVCDARDDDSSNTAGYLLIFLQQKKPLFNFAFLILTLLYTFPKTLIFEFGNSCITN